MRLRLLGLLRLLKYVSITWMCIVYQVLTEPLIGGHPFRKGVTGPVSLHGICASHLKTLQTIVPILDGESSISQLESTSVVLRLAGPALSPDRSNIHQ